MTYKNVVGRKCLQCQTTPEFVDIVERPEDREKNRLYVGCPDCLRFLAWAGGDEKKAWGFDDLTNPKSCRSSAFPSGVRTAILRRDNFTCQACGRKAPDVELHLDHIVPVTEGGLSIEQNGLTLCQECNLGKGKSTTVLDEFRAWRLLVRATEGEVGSANGS